MILLPLVVPSMLGSLLAAQDAKPAGAHAQRSFRFVYTAALPEVPAGAKQTRLWIPVPIDTPEQTIQGLTFSISGAGIQFNGTAKKATDLEDGQQGALKWYFQDIAGGFGRSLCVETAGTPIEVELAFDVTRSETKGGGKASAEELAELTQADKMIPLNGKVAAVAASMSLPADPRATARKLYDHTLERMKYDKPESGGWGRGDSEWACDAKFGNCTDFHSYFMGLARTKGLPARFEMGFSVPAGDEKEAKIGGYHCWAYVWIEGHGWMPVDISEADKNPAKAEYFFGTLDADRVTMTGGRDLTLTPSPTEGTLNFFVYPYAEVDGKKVDNATKGFKRINS